MMDSLNLSDVKIVVNEANSLVEAVEAAAYYVQAGVIHLVDEYAVHTYDGLAYRSTMREIAAAQKIRTDDEISVWIKEFVFSDQSIPPFSSIRIPGECMHDPDHIGFFLIELTICSVG